MANTEVKESGLEVDERQQAIDDWFEVMWVGDLGKKFVDNLQYYIDEELMSDMADKILTQRQKMQAKTEHKIPYAILAMWVIDAMKTAMASAPLWFKEMFEWIDTRIRVDDGDELISHTTAAMKVALLKIDKKFQSVVRKIGKMTKLKRIREKHTIQFEFLKSQRQALMHLSSHIIHAGVGIEKNLRDTWAELTISIADLEKDEDLKSVFSPKETNEETNDVTAKV